MDYTETNALAHTFNIMFTIYIFVIYYLNMTLKEFSPDTFCKILY